MIAPRHLPFADDFRRRTGSRAGRSAVRLRRARSRRLRYAVILRTFAALAGATACVVLYLGLVANVARMRLEISDNAQVRERLVDRTTQLEDKIARLESRDSLAKLAARLGMHEATTFALVTIPPERAQAAPRGVAFLNWLR